MDAALLELLKQFSQISAIGAILLWAVYMLFKKYDNLNEKRNDETKDYISKLETKLEEKDARMDEERKNYIESMSEMSTQVKETNESLKDVIKAVYDTNKNVECELEAIKKDIQEIKNKK